MTTCVYCGRANEPGALFCMDCGKPLAMAAAAKKAVPTPVPGDASAPAPAPMVPDLGASAPSPAAMSCPFCNGRVEEGLPYCPHCGRRLSAPGSGPACARCGSAVVAGTRFCATCGSALEGEPAAAAGLVRPSSRPVPRTEFLVRLVLMNDTGDDLQTFESHATDTTIGRGEGDVRFPDDAFMSPLHAKLSWEDSKLVARDLGSRNGTWVFLEEPHRLSEGDLLLIGSQIIRFRRLGYPGPYAPEVDATKRMGSLTPAADIASLTQLRADGSARDVIQLSPGRDLLIGREKGDWTFPYDPSMSAQHALIRSEDADFVVVDAGSRNGVALAARGAMPLKDGSRLLVGDKLLRIEIP